MKLKRSALGALSVVALVGSSLAFAAPAASGDPGQVPQVTICHRTNSVSNPYVKITVDQDAVDGDTTNDNGQGDHTLHTGPVFDATNPPPPPHNEDQWGDIIPDVYADGITPRPDGTPTLNWDAEGMAIFNNGCKPVEPIGSVEVQKVVENPDGVTIPATFSIHLVCTTDGGATTVLDEDLNLAGGTSSGKFAVPTGASCDATEDTAGIADLVSGSGLSDGPVTITTGGDSLLTVTNTFAAPTPEVVPEVVVSPAEASVAPAAVVAAPGFTG